MVILRVIRIVISYVDLNTGKIKAVCALPEPKGVYWFKRHRVREPLHDSTRYSCCAALHPLEGSIADSKKVRPVYRGERKR